MYRIMILMSLVLGLTAAAILLRRRGLPRQIVLLSICLNIFLTLYLSIFVTLILSGGKAIGLNASGAAMGMVAGVVIFSFITPVYRNAFLEAYITVLPLMYGIGKIGCSFAGCCFGMHYHGPFSVIGTDGAVRFPVQQLEAIVFILTFGGFLYLVLKDRFKPISAAIICAVIKILMDFLRDSHSGRIVSSNQLLCLFIIVFSIAMDRLLFRKALIRL